MFTDAYTMSINGMAVSGAEEFDVINPASAEPFAMAPNCTRQELEDAIDAAREAQQTWGAMSPEERKPYILGLSGKIAEAALLISALTEDRPSDLAEAYRDAHSRGPPWRAHLHSSLKRSPKSKALIDKARAETQLRLRVLGFPHQKPKQNQHSSKFLHLLDLIVDFGKEWCGRDA